ncbi:Predicted DNA-binding transcriptional regulator YafY, contains an HTH and WYL domains [Streptomyces sp. 2224.1]|uniref:helix-turn-helix transcriptional regulator n=1 Tax=unclassified Streptomyces TaxID=2593676 RepID=UPI0008923A1E|nr:MULTISPECIES: WYL domain-containing protein [unclassified Streptomyces]PBC84419.1 putative DNA-binding transcriptional regulator YafY [Streptomyces sp. 2321.6]SDR31091.1 Predicted DNA-binding transcriptional regulator YafY, contains an HTH and WYL domains [Streptomyces sp. KS_16]SEB72177.1 Predicted DNA-binding transcriptional regulator YafY, contains an HTH and WYL domains [Streptomyces sp. 2224.1]SED30712.1 Predicted DNA-binding transcriptional regulator YafY, contains an HTH and WYL domai
MKSDRLLSILLLLQTRGRVPAAELAERLEVSTRTVYRDVESLSAAGVPVYAERGRHGGIALLPGFRTDVTGMTTDEARALFILAAQGAHTALGLDEALGSALRKVMAALPAPHRPAAELAGSRILVDPDKWMSGPRPVVDLDELHTAVFTDRRLRIRYRHSGETRLRTYTVDPYGLVAKAGTWYLVADRRGRPQLFRADRVASATLTDAPVRRRAGVGLAGVWQQLRRQVEDRPAEVRVTARIRRNRLDLAVRILSAALTGPPRTGDGEGTGNGKETETGGNTESDWAVIELAYPVIGAVRQLLQFGDSLEVLAPPEARRVLAEAAAALTAVYADDRPGRPERPTTG